MMNAGAYSANEQQRDRVTFLVIVLAALLARIVVYPGIFGSDDMTYIESALRMLQGNEHNSSYIGAIRHGVNLPMAAFFAGFGVSEFSANIWSMLTGSLEVGVVFLLARLMLPYKGALLASLTLLFLPLHMHYSGRIMADTPLSFFLLCSVYFFVKAERNNSNTAYIVSGVALGFAYWVKAVAAVLIVPAFIVYALIKRYWRNGWIAFVLAAFSVWIGHFILMWLLHGDLFHHVKSVFAAINKVNAEVAAQPFTFYLNKLFLDVRHTWLLGIMAVAGIFLARKCALIKQLNLVIVWAVSVLLLLSLLQLKQSNYLLLVTAPLCILGGVLLQKIKLQWVVVAVFIPGLLLGALKQHDLKNYTLNARSIAAAASGSPVDIIISNQKVLNIVYQTSLLDGSATAELLSLDDMNSLTATKGLAWLILDKRTANADDNKEFAALQDSFDACITPLQVPIMAEQYLGKFLFDYTMSLLNALPDIAVLPKVKEKLGSIFSDEKLTAWQLDIACARDKVSN